MDLDFKFLEPLGLWLDLDWVSKIQDWIWIAKYDSPLISGLLPRWNAQPDIVSFMNCTVVAWSVVCSGILTWSADSAQSFAPWQQATIAIMLAISLTIACSRYIYYTCRMRTCRSGFPIATTPTNKERGCRIMCTLSQQTSPKQWFGKVNMYIMHIMTSQIAHAQQQRAPCPTVFYTPFNKTWTEHICIIAMKWTANPLLVYLSIL